LAASDLSRTIGNDRGQAETFDGKTDGQNLTLSYRQRFAVTSKSGLTVNFESIREHSCEFAGGSCTFGG
jgi:hypothetical protein